MCAFRAANISAYIPMTVDGLTRAITAQFIYKDEPQLANAVQAALVKCIDATYSAVTTNAGFSDGKFICDPNSLLIKGCINLEIFKLCPSKRLINKLGCDDFRRYLGQCIMPLEDLAFYQID